MFKYHSLHIKRTLPLALLIIVMATGVIFYAKNQEIISNFKPYYYKSYLAAFKYKISHRRATTASETATSIPVLLYHGIVTGKSEGEDTNISSFTDQLTALKNAGYQTISMDEYYKFIYEGQPVPKKSFLLTFDDGRKDSYYAVEPLLRAFNFKATMFVITSKSLTDKTSVYYLSKEELKKMRDGGHWDIQTHTQAGHDIYPIDPTNKGPFYANKLWLTDQKRYETNDEFRDRVHNDLAGAKSDIQKELGITPIAFAVPFGDIGEGATNYSGAKQALLAEARSLYPITFVQSTNGRPYSQDYLGSKDALEIRIEPKPGWSPEDLLKSIAQSDAKGLPYSVTPKIEDGWRNPWGNTFTTDGINLQAGVSTTGATITLDGTYGWRDYTSKTTATITRGSNFRVILRQINTDNYLTCSYSPDSVKIEQVKNGNTIALATKEVKINLLKQHIFTDTVKGSNISCGLPDSTTKPLTAKIPELSLSSTGGIGFLVYDKTANNAEGIIKKLEVSVAK